jgi:hypothetical protein
VGLPGQNSIRLPLPGARRHLADRTGITDVDGRFDLALPADLSESARVMTITAPGHAP